MNKRSILAFIAGLVSWVVVVTVINRLLRVTVDGYAAAEPTMTFTLGMQWARLTMAFITSLIAGAIAGRIAPSSRRTPWVLGLVILALFIPAHIQVWQSFPIWYHLTFLLTIVPLIL